MIRVTLLSRCCNKTDEMAVGNESREGSVRERREMVNAAKSGDTRGNIVNDRSKEMTGGDIDDKAET
jgi:hypothetical protein